MPRGKVQTWIVIPDNAAPRATRLMQGTLREVEQVLRGEVEIRVATAAEAHGMANVEIEDCRGEP